VGVGTGAMAMVLAATIANRWFVARKGLVIGVLTASTATGQLLFLPLLAAVVQHAGWRAAALVVTGVALLLLPVVLLLLRDEPRDLGLRAFGDAAGAASPARSAPSPTGALAALVEGSRSRDFWLLVGSFFICGLSTNGLIGTHLIPASMDHGIPAVTAAGLLAGMGVFDLIGTTVSGWLSDRWDNRRLLFCYYGLRGLSLMLLPYAYGSEYFGLTLFAVFYGLDWVATVPPTVRLTETLFGKHRVGIMYGWIAVAHQMGAATAAFGAGVLRTWLGSYQVAFTGAGFVCLVAALMVLAIGHGQIALRPRPRRLEISGAVEG
jgi:predicted MFS family arabinose efflux permease